MTTCIALLRGINVGTAKRVAMADLRALFEELGHAHVRTLLNSGNVVFEAARPDADNLSASIDKALQAKRGFSAAVIVMTAADLNAIIRADRLLKLAKDPAKHLVAFVARPAVLTEARALLERSWKPDAIAIGRKAAYLWCAKGIIKSELMKAFSRLTGDGATTRNWATVLKLQAMTGRLNP
jgi:uncharacterized protein (DUF1697 family)